MTFLAVVRGMNDMLFEDLWQNALIMADRREHLCKNAPACPQCHTKQVQLVVRDIPAGWVCRHCGYNFDYEPGE
jgi:transposase-like protein